LQAVKLTHKRLRYFMQRDCAVLGMVMRIFLGVIARKPFKPKAQARRR
jgi:hypothetical protein